MGFCSFRINLGDLIQFKAESQNRTTQGKINPKSQLGLVIL